MDLDVTCFRYRDGEIARLPSVGFHANRLCRPFCYNKGMDTEGKNANMAYTAQQVAEWMVEEIRFTGNLYQTEAIRYVRENFGEEFVFVNENGNASLSKDVKKAFRKLHGGRIAWDRDGFMWAWT